MAISPEPSAAPAVKTPFADLSVAPASIPQTPTTPTPTSAVYARCPHPMAQPGCAVLLFSLFQSKFSNFNFVFKAARPHTRELLPAKHSCKPRRPSSRTPLGAPPLCLSTDHHPAR